VDAGVGALGLLTLKLGSVANLPTSPAVPVLVAVVARGLFAFVPNAYLAARLAILVVAAPIALRLFALVVAADLVAVLAFAVLAAECRA